MNTHDKENTIAFMEKAKKQAKRLLKFAKEHELKITINNLSDAQTWIAKINGYPDWHALNKNFTNILKKDSEQDIIVQSNMQFLGEKIHLQKLNELYVLEQEEHLTSFFELSSLPFNSYREAALWISSLKDNLSFKWNMGFHDIKILFDFFNQEEASAETNNFFEWTEILGMTQEQFNEIFSINLKPQPKGFSIKAICAITTTKDQSHEHISLCKEFKNDFFNKEWIFKDELDLLNFQSNKLNILDDSKSFYNLSLEKLVSGYSQNAEVNLNWLYGIQTLYQKKVPLKLVANISNEAVTLDIVHSEFMDKKFLNGLWTSLNKKIYTNHHSNLNSSDSFYFSNDEGLNLTSSNAQTVVPWSEGIPFINKTDGNIIKIKPTSQYQTTLNSLIYAKPGSGKSALLNTFNIDKIIQQSNEMKGEIPFVGVIDIGHSSAGVIHFLKNCLPQNKKDQILYHKWHEGDIVNPFDTELGSRYPSPLHNLFLTNFLVLLSSLQKVENGISGAIQAAIHLAYDQASENGMPKKYDKGYDNFIDESLKKINFVGDYRTSWWEIVDALFKAGLTHEATLAQRYAMPLLSDILTTFQNDKLRDVYGRVTVSTGETILQYLTRMIVEFTNNYPNFNKPTQLSFNNAKVVSIDLDEVAKVGGLASQKKIAIYYSLATSFMAKHFKLYTKEIQHDLYELPIIYHEYYKQQRSKNLEMASISFDEAHRVLSFPVVEDIIIGYLRESRKYRFSFTLATQMLDNTDNISAMCSNHFFATNSYSKDEIRKLIRELELKNANVISELKNNKYSFGDWLYKANTKQVDIEKIVSFNITPFLLWIISTLIEDCLIRNEAVKKFGYIEAIKLLSTKYPHGIKKSIELIIEQRKCTREEVIQEVISKL